MYIIFLPCGNNLGNPWLGWLASSTDGSIVHKAKVPKDFLMMGLHSLFQRLVFFYFRFGMPYHNKSGRQEHIHFQDLLSLITNWYSSYHLYMLFPCTLTESWWGTQAVSPYVIYQTRFCARSIILSSSSG